METSDTKKIGQQTAQCYSMQECKRLTRWPPGTKRFTNCPIIFNYQNKGLVYNVV